MHEVFLDVMLLNDERLSHKSPTTRFLLMVRIMNDSFPSVGKVSSLTANKLSPYDFIVPIRLTNLFPIALLKQTSVCQSSDCCEL